MATSSRIYSGPTDLRNRQTTVYASPRLIVKFEMDRAGIAKLAVGRELRSAVHHTAAERAMPYAIGISPHGKTGNYVGSWDTVDTYAVIAGMRRVATKLINNSPHAAAVEWGRGGNQGILRRTLAHLNGTSPIALATAARQAAFDPQLHPRGPRGRFTRLRAAGGRRATN